MIFRKRFLLKIILLISLMLFSFVYVKKYHLNKHDYNKKVYALVAKKNLYPGYKITRSDVRWKEELLRNLPKNIIILKSDFARKIYSMSLTSLVYKGGYILKSDLEQLPYGSELSANVTKGMIAVNLLVKSDYIANRIKAGDKVNLILTRTSDNSDVIVDEILSNVVVININNYNNTEPPKVKKNKSRKSFASWNMVRKNNTSTGKKNTKQRFKEVVLEVPKEISLNLYKFSYSGGLALTVVSKRDSSNSSKIKILKTITHINGNDNSITTSIITKKGT